MSISKSIYLDQNTIEHLETKTNIGLFVHMFAILDLKSPIRSYVLKVSNLEELSSIQNIKFRSWRYWYLKLHTIFSRIESQSRRKRCSSRCCARRNTWRERRRKNGIGKRFKRRLIPLAPRKLLYNGRRWVSPSLSYTYNSKQINFSAGATCVWRRERNWQS